MYFDDVFRRKEPTVRKNIEIDDALYTKLEEYTKVYDATIGELVDACIECLLRSGELPFYESKKPLFVLHTLRIKSRNAKGLEELKSKYGISFFRLVNIAIHYTLVQTKSEAG